MHRKQRVGILETSWQVLDGDHRFNKVRHQPGLPMSAAIPVAIGAMFVAYLRLPLSAIIIASLLCASAGAGGSPLVIVGVVVAYLATVGLERRLGSSTTADHDEANSPPAAAPEPTAT